MSRRPVLLSLLILVCDTVQVHAQHAPPSLHVLRITSGPAGVEEKGTFRLTDERSVFSRSDDKEVIVYFQWDGAPGRHQLEATWRSPDGTTSSKTAIDYTAKERRFGAYWRFVITRDMQLGMWSVEAYVKINP